MGEITSCGLTDLGIMGLIIGSVIVSISYSLFKKGKAVIENEFHTFGAKEIDWQEEKWVR